MKKRPKILITNDDGVHAPGIKFLWKALKDMADAIIIAPAHEQSSVGLSITLRHPLHIQQVHWEDDATVWSVTGTPADCVKMALSVILKEKPDLVVSGINHGTNSGRNMLYSGTVAGIIEAILHDIPGIAFSSNDYPMPDFTRIAHYTPSIVEYVLKHPLPSGTLLNVNFPASKHGNVKGFKMARQGKSYWMENPKKSDHPTEGHSYYWLGSKLHDAQEQPDSDVYWLNKGYVTAVPMHIGELTDHGHLSKHKDHFESWFDK